MSLTLAEFTDTVRSALARGSVLDSVIATKIRQAARSIEQNVDTGYLYMRRLRTFTLHSASDYPHILDVPNDRVKSYLFFRIVEDDGFYTYLTKIDPQEVSQLNRTKPKGYWLDGTARIVFDAKPDKDYTLEVLWVEYSAWSLDGNFTHWLFDNAEAALFNWTLCLMAPWLRDARMIETFKSGRDEALHLLEGARIDLEETNTSTTMAYEGGRK